MASTVKPAGATEAGEEDVIEDTINNDSSGEETQMPAFPVVSMDTGSGIALTEAIRDVNSINTKTTK